MISKGKPSKVCYEDIRNLNQIDVAKHYLRLKRIPCVINSPLREDRNPSFAFYCPKSNEVNYRDFATGDSGTIYSLLSKLWKCDYQEVYRKVLKELKNENLTFNTKCSRKYYNTHFDLQCKTREWYKYDIEYWGSYGISLKWLKYADVYPISHKIIIKDNIKYVYKADKYAYAYVEFKEGNTTLKIYQPFNKNGFKWSNKHDSSVISLWTKIPEKGDKLCICSSLKDALCLWINTGIPAIAVQGEGYNISNTACSVLKSRFKHIFICFDNDKTGLKDAEKLSKKTQFTNIIIPHFNGGKDISDYYKQFGKESFKALFTKLFI